ncbi:tetratricopeptide repeat protein [Umezawaea sp. Da 62-37]|uniref:ATP-binding protein n=1 Tax=Umezawaea sp. Da 62-37 TaxID=3075927 RepID=UPI0028F6CC61|nr:tetratricopeptide repeat protein [Umezawaea sp. Da 62-37]WNV82633.1 tetratricopeptide repeat protein [Umezawaea sp. Da 62-37]
MPRQLPADVRGFVNRFDDLESLTLTSAEVADRVVVWVVVGTAGVGKTSLAVRWAHQVAGDFPDGQLYVNLRGYDAGLPIGPDEALDRFLRALGVPGNLVPADLDARSALFRSLLAGRKFLILLDNAASPTQVRPLLPGTAGCLVLVTSRDKLAGLVARDGARRLRLDILPLDEAVSLLRELIHEYRPQDDDEDLAQLAGLCARLPLALRIAAERAIGKPRTSLRDMITELRDESSLWDALGSDDSDAVRTVFAWSYRALSKGASRLFRMLGLYPGDDFGPAAVAVLLGEPVPTVRRLLEDLAGAHLLASTAPDRYEFHDLLRLYAQDQARTEESPESATAALERLAAWYLHAVWNAVRTLIPEAAARELPALPPEVSAPVFADHEDAFAWYEHERRNLRSMIRVLEAQGRNDAVALLADILREIYARYNHFDDWITTGVAGLAAARRSGNRRGEADALESLGKAHTQQGNRAEGIEHQTSALSIRQEIGDRRGELASTNALGLAHLRNHEPDTALRHFRRSLEIADDLADGYWTAVASNNIANALIDLDRPQEAVPLLHTALAGYRRLSIPGGEGDALRGLSHAHRLLGVPDQAHRFIGDALSIARDRKNQAWEAFWSLEAGQVSLALGDPDEALVLYQRAASLQRQLGDRVREAAVLDATGEAYQRSGRPADATAFHRYAVDVFRQSGERWRLAVGLRNLGSVLIDTEGLPAAVSVLDEAAALFAQFDDPAARRHHAEVGVLRRGGEDGPATL